MANKYVTMMNLSESDLLGEWRSGIIINEQFKGELRLYLALDPIKNTFSYNLTIDDERGIKRELRGVYSLDHTSQNTQLLKLDSFREFEIWSLAIFPSKFVIRGFNKSDSEKLNTLTKTA